jgi:hypothetical protein
LKPKIKKQRPEWQIYSTLYFKEKLKDCIHAEWEEFARDEGLEENGVIPKIPLKFINKRICEYYALETQDVKDQVKEQREKESQEDTLDLSRDSDDDMEDDERKRRRKLMDYQQ